MDGISIHVSFFVCDYGLPGCDAVLQVSMTTTNIDTDVVTRNLACIFLFLVALRVRHRSGIKFLVDEFPLHVGEHFGRIHIIVFGWYAHFWEGR
jgi:hypothetical protein